MQRFDYSSDSFNVGLQKQLYINLLPIAEKRYKPKELNNTP